MPAAARSKKKAVTEAAPANEIVADPSPVEPAPAPVTAEPKKRASKAATKKPVKVVAVVTPNGIEGSFLPEPRRPLIAHLQIRTNEVVFHDQPLQYDPNPPQNIPEPVPYDAGEFNLFSGGQETLTDLIATPRKGAVGAGGTAAAAAAASPPKEEVVQEATQKVSAAAPEHAPMPCFTRADLMVQFQGASEVKQLPPSTEVACFWCAHGFDWKPCVIPEREVGGVYNVYGNFCCPECAAAYLLSESLDPHVRWERMALLQRIYDRTGKARIFPAPARESLKLFGGPMSIETYRATVRAGKVRVDLHMPPMVSILGSIDTKPIDFFDTNVKNTLTGLPADKVQKAEEGLRLKRTKPLKDRESTLDTVMNIQISRR
jgi:hypothetical protein